MPLIALTSSIMALVGPSRLLKILWKILLLTPLQHATQQAQTALEPGQKTYVTNPRLCSWTVRNVQPSLCLMDMTWYIFRSGSTADFLVLISLTCLLSSVSGGSPAGTHLISSLAPWISESTPEPDLSREQQNSRRKGSDPRNYKGSDPHGYPEYPGNFESRVGPHTAFNDMRVTRRKVFATLARSRSWGCCKGLGFFMKATGA